MTTYGERLTIYKAKKVHGQLESGYSDNNMHKRVSVTVKEPISDLVCNNLTHEDLCLLIASQTLFKTIKRARLDV